VDTGPACDAQVPLSAVQALGKRDALIWLLEWDTSGRSPIYTSNRSSPPRPDHFDVDAMTPFDCASSAPSDPGLMFRTTSFRDRGREFLVHVVLGSEASDRRAEVAAILDSFQVT